MIVAFNFALLREFGSYMMQHVGYWILGLIAFLIPAFVLVFLCVYLAQEYQGAKRSARLQKDTDQAVKAKKNPMPSICLWDRSEPNVVGDCRDFAAIDHHVSEQWQLFCRCG